MQFESIWLILGCRLAETKSIKPSSLDVEARYRIVFECGPLGICHMTPSGIILEANAALQRMLRATGPDMAGMPLADIAHPAEAEALRIAVRKVASGRRERIVKECHFVRKDGRLLWANLTLAGVPEGDSELRMLTALIEDISTRKAQEAALKRQSMHDEVTDLPSRGLFMDRLSHTIRTARRDGTVFTVLVLDIHHFRNVNQSFGERWGDLVLRQVGERLQRRLRGADTVARLQDAEFGGILIGNSEDDAVRAAGRLIQALRKPCIVEDGKRLALSGSVGMALYPDHGEDADTLLRHAHYAMRTARSAGLDYAVYRSPED